ncbi:MAG: sensor histidine kinase [Lachnospiraceae bacterium]|nr:sensor histidine kinase [Lachnospiraceae bacterium]
MKRWGLVKRISSWLDDRKWKHKMMFLYVICMLLPVVLIDSMMLYLVVSYDTMTQRRQMENIATAVSYDLTSTVETAVNVTVDVSTNKTINRFLNTSYENNVKYYAEYYSLLMSGMFRCRGLGNSADLMIFSSNETLVSGGDIASQKLVENEEWYQAFINSGREVLLYPYFNDRLDLTFAINSKRRISLIRRMGLYSPGWEHIIKLDIDYNALSRDFLNAGYSNSVYVCFGDKILFSNVKDTVGNNDFGSWAAAEGTVGYQSQISLYGQCFDIYVMESQVSILDRLSQMYPYLLVILAVSLLFPLFPMLMINRSLTRRLFALREAFSRADNEHLETIEVRGKDEIGDLTRDYNKMITRIRQLIEEVYLEKLKRQDIDMARQRAELLALHSQVNPHFMFNAMESIRMHSLLKGEHETADVLEDLAILMRKSVEWGMDNITIREEMTFVQAYLKLQKYRFGEKLSYRFEIDEECLMCRIPKLTIVTFVENSCVHGLENSSRSGWVFISVKKREEEICIEVEDTGTGIAEDYRIQLQEKMQNMNIETLEQSESIGILNACLRLRMFSGNQARFELESEEKVGTTISIRIPAVWENGEEMR